MDRLSAQRGFTLVEIATTLVIIGLLIGGALAGMEIVENARVVSTIKQVRSYDAATLAFQNTYGALPGDIKQPTRIPGCTTSPCTLAGDGNKFIGDTRGDYFNNENNTFWLHLLKAGLIDGVNPNSSWTPPDYKTASYPKAPIGGDIMIMYNILSGTATWPDGLSGHWWLFGKGISTAITGTSTPYGIDSSHPVYMIESAVPLESIRKVDLKIDDGKPWTGRVKLGNQLSNKDCNMVPAQTTYPTGSRGLCAFYIKTIFK